MTSQRWRAEQIVAQLSQYSATLRQMGVQSLGLFGSYQRDTATPKSDMDFLVSLEHISFDSYMELKFFLEDLFGCKVDLVLEHTLRPCLRPYILKEIAYVQEL